MSISQSDSQSIIHSINQIVSQWRITIEGRTNVCQVFHSLNFIIIFWGNNANVFYVCAVCFMLHCLVLCVDDNGDADDDDDEQHNHAARSIASIEKSLE